MPECEQWTLKQSDYEPDYESEMELSSNVSLGKALKFRHHEPRVVQAGPAVGGVEDRVDCHSVVVELQIEGKVAGAMQSENTGRGTNEVCYPLWCTELASLFSNVEKLEDYGKVTDEYWDYQQMYSGSYSGNINDTPIIGAGRYKTFQGNLMGSICKIGTLILDVAGEIVQDTHASLGKNDPKNSSVTAFEAMQVELVDLHKLFKAP